MKMLQTSDNHLDQSNARGARLWLIVAKVICVAVYAGGVTTVLGVWLWSGMTHMQLDDPQRQWVIDMTRFVLVYLVVPALLGAIFLGLALLLQRPRELIRMRWLQVKLIGLVVLIPTAHLFCRSRMGILRAATDQSVSNQMATQLVIAFSVALIGSLIVVVLARVKPRFSAKNGGFGDS